MSTGILKDFGTEFKTSVDTIEKNIDLSNNLPILSNLYNILIKFQDIIVKIIQDKIKMDSNVNSEENNKKKIEKDIQLKNDEITTNTQNIANIYNQYLNINQQIVSLTSINSPIYNSIPRDIYNRYYNTDININNIINNTQTQHNIDNNSSDIRRIDRLLLDNYNSVNRLRITNNDLKTYYDSLKTNLIDKTNATNTIIDNNNNLIYFNASKTNYQNTINSLNNRIQNTNNNNKKNNLKNDRRREETSLANVNNQITVANNTIQLKTALNIVYTNNIATIKSALTALRITLTNNNINFNNQINESNTLRTHLVNIITIKENDTKIKNLSIEINKLFESYANEYKKKYINELNLTELKKLLEISNNKLIDLNNRKKVIDTDLLNNVTQCTTKKEEYSYKTSTINNKLENCETPESVCLSILTNNEYSYNSLYTEYNKIRYTDQINCHENFNENIINTDNIETMINEGFDNNYDDVTKFNNNKEVDIKYINYYSKFINDIKRTDDLSQNLINLQNNIEIDTYYILKYNAQIDVLKSIIFICCLSLLGSLLYHNSLITSSMYTLYACVVFGVGIVYISYKLFNIFMRSNLNFNEYDYNSIFRPDYVKYNTKNLNTIELSNLDSEC